ncbi:MAG: hypothetical protein EKK49_08820 [Rhodocyclaceae bacterium]|nr:MAG: hypothetical protein EKK49_08820 [Rhodocyclaceae bacterium]
MNAPTFTPGPWHEHSHRQIGPSRGIVCEVWSAIGETTDDAIAQGDANVHLIAAAPDLYQVAIEAEALLSRQKWLPNPASPKGALLLVLRAALAKAEGRAEV